mgnify:CR=1 FL=1
MKPTLEAFLKTNGAYGLYINNVTAHVGEYLTEKAIRDISRLKGSLCFDAAFPFAETPEGYFFWRKLSYEFDKIDK